MSCVITHLLTPSLPPLLHGQAFLQYNYEKCLFLSDVFNSSSCLHRTHIIYWMEADQYVFWLFSYNALLQTLPHLIFNLWYTKSQFLHILRTNVFWIHSLSVHAIQQLVQGKTQLCVSHFKNESCEKLCYPCSECGMSVALKVILAHLQTIIHSRILQSVFQKSSMAYGPEHKAYVSLYFILAGVS